MADIDLNLLIALDALLSEGSVAGAARRLDLSESAMSRTLSRLRTATGDELLVRAGRAMVPTPHALALRERVRELSLGAQQVLQPAGQREDPASLQRSFTLRANDAFIEVFAPRLVAHAAEAAPGVQLCFAPKPNKDVRPLREGLIDLDIGVLGEAGPEVRVQTLYRDRFVGAARPGHALLREGVMPTAERYAACAHVVTSRRGRSEGPVDAALTALGLERRVAVIVPSFRAALSIASSSELVALLPASYFERLNQSGALQAFELPVSVPPITISQMWHPRLDRDAAHRWLRGLMLEICSPDRPA
ncbi:MAG TPA: LysR family transcriptional regulator [Burkholderiaceae bacterium]|jgi:DNA-binding transcriptional LysR family regulator